jgi:hypothetical protein
VVRGRLGAVTALAAIAGAAACGDLLGLKDFQLDPMLEGGSDDGPSPDGNAGDGMNTKDAPPGDDARSDGEPVDGQADSPGDSFVQDAPADTFVQDSPPGDATSCDAGNMLCNGHCVDLSSDPSNCGSCGHDCQGGTCQSSACQPVTLSTNVKGWDITVDPANVDSVNALPPGTGLVQRCSTGGCGNNPVTVTGSNGENGPERVFYSGGTLFWTEYGTGASDGLVWTSDFNASSHVATGRELPEGIVYDGTWVYWAERQPSGSIMKAHKNGSSLTQLIGGLATPVSLALDAQGYIYWTYETGGGSGNGGVSRCLTSSCTELPLATATTGPAHGLALDASYLYWTEVAASGNVWRAQHDGNGGTKLASGQDSVYRIASDGTNVYWTNDGSGELMRCSTGGCASPTVLASGLSMPMGVALDANAVYYASYGDATLRKLAK